MAVDASGTFGETKRQVGLLRMLQAGVIISDYTTLMVEILKDNGRPEAGEIYGAMEMGWAKLVGSDCPRVRKVNGWPLAHHFAHDLQGSSPRSDCADFVRDCFRGFDDFGDFVPSTLS